MFFQTEQKLLRPIHSLLKSPFSFYAKESISKSLYHQLHDREDYADLLALGELYDAARESTHQSLIRIRPLLESSLSAVIPFGSDVGSVCRVKVAPASSQRRALNSPEFLSVVSVQCQLERLYDLLDLRQMGSGPAWHDSIVAEAIRTLMLGEVLALCLAGTAKVKATESSFHIERMGDSARDLLRATWFARCLDQSSHTGTLTHIKWLASNGASHAHELGLLIERIFDQDLAIPWERLTERGKSLQSTQQLFHAVSTVAVILVATARNEPVKMSRDHLNRRGLNFGEVSLILQRQQKALVTDRYLSRQGDMLCVRVEAVSKGLRSYYRMLQDEFNERDLLREHVGGFFFEETHIRQRIEHGDDYTPRYRILDGFDRHQVLDKVENESDVEFIIHDTQLVQFYFVQVKHSLMGEQAFFSAMVQAAQKDIGKGIHQLREAKRLLTTSKLATTLAARGASDATASNSHFVLLHNIAQFDFQYTTDGISLYDWATFRNLLKDAECNVGSTDTPPSQVRLQTPLVINHPMSVINRLLTEHAGYKWMNPGVWAAEMVTTEYAMLGKKIRIQGLGI